jgi:hypothetical protein
VIEADQWKSASAATPAGGIRSPLGACGRVGDVVDQAG